jgi:hypothetical protein
MLPLIGAIVKSVVVTATRPGGGSHARGRCDSPAETGPRLLEIMRANHNEVIGSSIAGAGLEPATPAL